MSTGDYTSDLPAATGERDNDRKPRFHGSRYGPRRGTINGQSRTATLSPPGTSRSRAAFNNTRTLKSAFQTASSSAEIDEHPTTPPKSAMFRARKQSITSMSDLSPPGAGIETYGDANANGLDSQPLQNGYNFLRHQDRDSRMRNHSPSPGARHYRGEKDDADDEPDPDLSFLDDLTDETLRKKLAQHAMDERRLKRVTSQKSPVFSRAKTGPRSALSVENLQRRRDFNSEESSGTEPPLNIPSSWGARGRVSKDWLSKTRRSNENGNQEEKQLDRPVQDSEQDVDFTARSLQISDSPPVRNSIQTRTDTNIPSRKIISTNRLRRANLDLSDESNKPSTGERIPNTPVVVYKSLDQDKPRMIYREDSQDLIRKLARTESPNSSNTPEQKVPVEDPVPTTKTPAKTPVVTGAWIDTPATEKATDETADNTEVDRTPSKPAADVKKEESASPEVEKPQSNLPERRERHQNRELEKPDLPKSALEKVIRDAQNGDHSLVLGENTIDSLQELLEDNPAILEFKSSVDSTGDEIDEAKDIDKPLPANEAAIDRLNVKLQSLVKCINETRNGLTSLESQLSNEIDMSPPRDGNKKAHLSNRHDKHYAPNSLQSDNRHYLAIPLPRLWYRHPGNKRPRPTRLAWFLLGFFVWLFTEIVMCDYWCHPIEAMTCERNCLTPNPPRLPFVTPTMLWRWSHLSSVLDPIRTIFVAMFRFLGQLFGLWDGFVDQPYDAFPSTNTGGFRSHVQYHAPQQFDPGPGLGSDMGMSQDEVL